MDDVGKEKGGLPIAVVFVVDEAKLYVQCQFCGHTHVHTNWDHDITKESYGRVEAPCWGDRMKPFEQFYELETKFRDN